MIRKSFIILRDLSNESVEFDDPKEGDDPQISNEPKEISIGGMDLDLLIHKSTVNVTFNGFVLKSVIFFQ